MSALPQPCLPDRSAACCLRVLLVASDTPDIPALTHGLRASGIVVRAAHSLADADAVVRAGEVDTIVLDLLGHEAEALEMLAAWRRDGVGLPILLLTGCGDTRGAIYGLNLGADTFLTRPVTPRLLLAQLRALLRPVSLQTTAILRTHDLEIDTSTRTVKRAGKWIALTRREYQLLHLLASQCGQVLNRALIWEQVYDGQRGPRSNVVEACIRGLRGKIDRGFDLPLILTQYGRGYLLRADEA